MAVILWGVTSLRIHNTLSGQSNSQALNMNKKLDAHFEGDSPIYDEQRYLVDLAQKQNAFKQQVTEIQNDFAGINMMLNDRNLSQN